MYLRQEDMLMEKALKQMQMGIIPMLKDIEQLQLQVLCILMQKE